MDHGREKAVFQNENPGPAAPHFEPDPNGTAWALHVPGLCGAPAGARVSGGYHPRPGQGSGTAARRYGVFIGSLRGLPPGQHRLHAAPGNHSTAALGHGKKAHLQHPLPDRDGAKTYSASSEPELVSWVLSFGDEAMVIEPDWLLEAVKAQVRRMREKY